MVHYILHELCKWASHFLRQSKLSTKRELTPRCVSWIKLACKYCKSDTLLNFLLGSRGKAGFCRLSTKIIYHGTVLPPVHVKSRGAISLTVIVEQGRLARLRSSPPIAFFFTPLSFAPLFRRNARCNFSIAVRSKQLPYSTIMDEISSWFFTLMTLSDQCRAWWYFVAGSSSSCTLTAAHWWRTQDGTTGRPCMYERVVEDTGACCKSSAILISLLHASFTCSTAVTLEKYALCLDLAFSFHASFLPFELYWTNLTSILRWYCAEILNTFFFCIYIAIKLLRLVHSLLGMLSGMIQNYRSTMTRAVKWCGVGVSPVLSLWGFEFTACILHKVQIICIDCTRYVFVIMMSDDQA